MRTEILNFVSNIAGGTLDTFTVSSKLPFEDNGAPLYHHNKKYIYVDIDNTSQQAVFDGLNGSGSVQETITVQVYFVTDAKQLPTNYSALVDAIKLARLVTASGVIQRLVQVTTSYIADSLVTEFEFSFKKLLTN
jgi:hypothetical protein